MKPIKSKPQKIAQTQALKQMGVSNKKIAQALGISDDSVARYLNKELDDKWRQYAEALKKIFMEQDFELARISYEKIKDKIDDAKFFELVGLYKVARELQQPKGETNIAVQGEKVLIIPSTLAEKYGASRDTGESS